MSALRLAALIVAIQSLAFFAYGAAVLFLLWGYDGIFLPAVGLVVIEVAVAWGVIRSVT